MLETALVLLRLVQYGAASILFGSSLFFLYALPRGGPSSAGCLPWSRPLVGIAAAVLFCATILGLLTQTAIMAGSVSAALSLPSMEAVVTGMDLGKAAILRAAAAGAAALVLVAPSPSIQRWTTVSGLGAMASASFAWMGHAAATEGSEGWIHLLSDVLHNWAAAAWIGALCAFSFLLRRRLQPADALATYRALKRFSGAGSLLVGALVATGLINSWFLIGLENIESAWTTRYGLVLLLKLFLFAAMLALAGANRFWLTPRLEAALDEPGARIRAVSTLRRSVTLETALGFGVIGAVAWFGTLPPPAAM